MLDGMARRVGKERPVKAKLKFLVFAIFSTVSFAFAQGQSGRHVDPVAAQALRKACLIDYRAHCTGEEPALAIETACLAQYYANLSKGCQAALDNLRSGAAGGETNSQ